MRNTEQQNKINKTIGNRLKSIRLAKGYSRLKVAEALTISHQQLQKYEVGVNRICAAKLIIFCEFVGISVKEFFDNISRDGISEDMSLIKNIMNNISKLPVRKRILINKIIKSWI